MKHLDLNRRRVLRQLAIGASLTGPVLLSSFGRSALAAEASDYRALVCLFFFGGMDAFDTVLPYDSDSYARFAQLRARLFQQYDAANPAASRARTALLPLAPDTRFGSRRFALPAQLAGLKTLYDEGRLAIVGNLGPLLAPLTRADVEADSPLVPARLFSHNDQQSTWMASGPEGTRLGWGGRFADSWLDANAALGGGAFTALTTQATRLFLSGERVVPYTTGLNGAPRYRLLDGFPSTGSPTQAAQRARLRAHLGAASVALPQALAQDYADALARAQATNERFDEALQDVGENETAFPTSRLGRQLRAVARAISAREALGTQRQVFFVGIGGFDTHASQARTLPALHTEIDGATTAFQSAMDSLSLSRAVTLFTASDFGRTLSINDDGTDHGWAGHHLVVGGDVAGGRIVGDLPPYELDHPSDVGRGRFIPTTSVEQYAGSLGRWMGLTAEELNRALPNLRQFDGLPSLFADTS
ncbi:MAG: DUF1501 domain-containing protein [Pseudomonadota bacterium]